MHYVNNTSWVTYNNKIITVVCKLILSASDQSWKLRKNIQDGTKIKSKNYYLLCELIWYFLQCVKVMNFWIFRVKAPRGRNYAIQFCRHFLKLKRIFFLSWKRKKNLLHKLMKHASHAPVGITNKTKNISIWHFLKILIGVSWQKYLQ